MSSPKWIEFELLGGCRELGKSLVKVHQITRDIYLGKYHLFIKNFPPHILKNNFLLARIGIFEFCATAKADTKVNPQRANFADPSKNSNLLKTLRTFFEHF